MFCPHCNTWNDDNYNYCYNCGTKLHINNSIIDNKNDDTIDIAFISSDNIADPIGYTAKKKHDSSHKPTIFVWVWLCAAIIVVIFSIQMGKMIAVSADQKVNQNAVADAKQPKVVPASPIEIIEPTNGYAEVTTDHYILKVKVKPDSTVLVNSNNFSDLVNPDGILEASVNLPIEGINDINITVSTPNHSLARQSISIKRLPETVADAEKENDDSSNLPKTEDEYIRQAWNIPYDQLIKYPRVYQHKIGLFLGQIDDLNVQGDVTTFYLKLSSSKRLYIEYQGMLSSLQQGDNIKLYGEVDGTRDTTPRIKARYVYKR